MSRCCSLFTGARDRDCVRTVHNHSTGPHRLPVLTAQSPMSHAAGFRATRRQSQGAGSACAPLSLTEWPPATPQEESPREQDRERMGLAPDGW
mmetsp:Transcript_30891/g.52167  ORF Transcript_30891/g.52167 Transcript_30891/m.52167 type:complete len:93 (+) Transcript_30891:177-455(+)